MPTVNLKPQADGLRRGWGTLIGANKGLGFRAVDDSDGTAHDGAASYMNLLKGGSVSFPFFLQWAGGIPTLVTVNIVARRGGASHPEMQIGFLRGGTAAFHASMFNPGADWGLATRSFATNPITGLAWDSEDMAPTEVCVQNETGVNGNNDLTLVSVQVEYIAPHNYDPEDVRGSWNG